MVDHANVYRALVRLYPKGFRRHYGEDLVQTFADLLKRDGARRAWPRVALDLIVTVPRYRLETVMNPRQSTTTLYITIGALAGAGLLSIGIGLYPGALLLVIAAIVAVAERGRLATSARPPDPDRRRHLLTASLVLALACVISTTAFMVELSDDEHWNGIKLAAYNAVFFTTAITAIISLVLGLRTPRAPKRRSLIGSA